MKAEIARKTGFRILFYLFLTFMALIVLIPIIWAITGAFRPNAEIGLYSGLSLRTFIPQTFTFTHFVNLFEKLNMWRIIGNTVFVALSVTFGSLFINALTAYAFANIRFSGKNAIFLVVLSMLVLPIEILIIPLYFTLSDIGWLDTYMGLIIPFLAAPFGIFFLRQFFLNVPKALDEAAILDGCGHFRIFTRIYLPVSRTPLITLGLLVFLQQWDSFIVPVTLINDESKKLLQVAFSQEAVGLYTNDYGAMFAGVVIAIVPMIILFLCFQRHIIENVAATGIKG